MAEDQPIPLDDETQQVIRLLRNAAARCIRIMRNPPGGTEKGRAFASSRAAQQLAGINRDLNQVKGKLANVAAKKIAEAYRNGLLAGEQLANEAGVAAAGSAFTGGFSVVDRRRAQILAQQTVGDLSAAVDSIKATTGKVVRQCQALGLDNKAVNTLLAGGTIEGAPKETLRELKKLMRTAAIDGNIVTVNQTTGEARSFKPDYYAELVFQTKLAETTNIATVQRLRARKMFYVKIIGSSSRNFCTAFVGRVFYTGEGADPLGHFPNVRELPRGGPPFHPRCTKRYVAFVPSLATADQIENAKLKPNERELLGKTPSEAQKAYPLPPGNPDPLPPTGQPVGRGPGTPSSQPGIVKISDRIIIPKTGQLAAYAEETLAQIEQLHRLPASAREIPMRAVPKARYEGVFDPGPNWRIQIKSTTDTPLTTITHELGHYFEHQVAGGIPGAMTHPAFEPWREAVQQTRAFGQIYLEAMRTRGRYQNYLLHPAEMFARSYAQWVAESGNVKMMQEIKHRRDTNRLPIQWDDYDFLPISQAFNEVIERLGLKP